MNNFRAAANKIASTLMFALMTAQVRHLGVDFPLGQSIFARAIISLIIVLGLYTLRGELKTAFRTERLSAHFWRGLTSVFGMFFLFAAVARLPLVDATTITFLAPLMTVTLAALVLREKVRLYRWAAVLVGFLGVLMMVGPHLSGANPAMTSVALVGAACALGNAACIAAATVQVRRLTTTESTTAIMVYLSIIVALAGLATLPFGWQVPTSSQMLVLLGIGVCGALGQIFLTEGLRYAPASFVAPFDYTLMVWALMIGFGFFAEVPTLEVLGGAAIVIGTGLWVMWREGRSRALQAREDAGLAGMQ
jgi:drug/metabolite transporter (DMT)-like permease